MRTHEFMLVLDPFLGPPARAGGYQTLRASPPEGCEVVSEESAEQVLLRCRRPGRTRAVAVAELVGEIRHGYGIPHADDLGFEKLWEWVPGEFGEDLTLQLLLMAARRAEVVGWSTEDLIGLLHLAGGTDRRG
jgi:hypothetical protein